MMRKVTKRDATTKLKALSELAELLPSRDRGVLRGFLPAWAYTYTSLCMHNDRRVRAAAQGVTDGLVRAGLRKSFAPYLPDMMPHWWLVCSDPAREAAAAARLAFARMFPSADKQAEALAAYASDIATSLKTWAASPPEQLSDMRIATREEAAEQAERVHASIPSAVAALLHAAADGGTGGPLSPFLEATAQAAAAEAGAGSASTPASPAPAADSGFASVAAEAGPAVALSADPVAEAASPLAAAVSLAPATSATSAAALAAAAGPLRPLWAALQPLLASGSPLWAFATAVPTGGAAGAAAAGDGGLQALPAARRALFGLLRTAIVHAPHLICEAAAVNVPAAAADSAAEPAGASSAAVVVLIPRADVMQLLVGPVAGEKSPLCVPDAWAVLHAAASHVPGMWIAGASTGAATGAGAVAGAAKEASAAVTAATAAAGSERTALLLSDDYVRSLKAAAAVHATLPSAAALSAAAGGAGAGSATATASSKPIAALLLPPLLRLLRGASYGAPQATASALLPFVASLPKAVLLWSPSASASSAPAAGAKGGKEGKKGASATSAASSAAAEVTSCFGLQLAEALWSGLSEGGEAALQASGYTQLAGAVVECALFVLAAASKGHAAGQAQERAQAMRAAALIAAVAVYPLCVGGAAQVPIAAAASQHGCSAASSAASPADDASGDCVGSPSSPDVAAGASKSSTETSSSGSFDATALAAATATALSNLAAGARGFAGAHASRRRALEEACASAATAGLRRAGEIWTRRAAEGVEAGSGAAGGDALLSFVRGLTGQLSATACAVLREGCFELPGAAAAWAATASADAAPAAAGVVRPPVAAARRLLSTVIDVACGWPGAQGSPLAAVASDVVGDSTVSLVAGLAAAAGKLAPSSDAVPAASSADAPADTGTAASVEEAPSAVPASPAASTPAPAPSADSGASAPSLPLSLLGTATAALALVSTAQRLHVLGNAAAARSAAEACTAALEKVATFVEISVSIACASAVAGEGEGGGSHDDQRLHRLHAIWAVGADAAFAEHATSSWAVPAAMATDTVVVATLLMHALAVTSIRLQRLLSAAAAVEAASPAAIAPSLVVMGRVLGQPLLLGLAELGWKSGEGAEAREADHDDDDAAVGENGVNGTHAVIGAAPAAPAAAETNPEVLSDVTAAKAFRLAFSNPYLFHGDDRLESEQPHVDLHRVAPLLAVLMHAAHTESNAAARAAPTVAPAITAAPSPLMPAAASWCQREAGMPHFMRGLLAAALAAMDEQPAAGPALLSAYQQLAFWHVNASSPVVASAHLSLSALPMIAAQALHNTQLPAHMPAVVLNLITTELRDVARRFDSIRHFRRHGYDLKKLSRATDASCLLAKRLPLFCAIAEIVISMRGKDKFPEAVAGAAARAASAAAEAAFAAVSQMQAAAAAVNPSHAEAVLHTSGDAAVPAVLARLLRTCAPLLPEGAIARMQAVVHATLRDGLLDGLSAQLEPTHLGRRAEGAGAGTAAGAGAAGAGAAAGSAVSADAKPQSLKEVLSTLRALGRGLRELEELQQLSRSRNRVAATDAAAATPGQSDSAELVLALRAAHLFEHDGWCEALAAACNDAPEARQPATGFAALLAVASACPEAVAAAHAGAPDAAVAAARAACSRYCVPADAVSVAVADIAAATWTHAYLLQGWLSMMIAVAAGHADASARDHAMLALASVVGVDAATSLVAPVALALVTTAPAAAAGAASGAGAGAASSAGDASASATASTLVAPSLARMCRLFNEAALSSTSQAGTAQALLAVPLASLRALQAATDALVHRAGVNPGQQALLATIATEALLAAPAAALQAASLPPSAGRSLAEAGMAATAQALMSALLPHMEADACNNGCESIADAAAGAAVSGAGPQGVLLSALHAAARSATRLVDGESPSTAAAVTEAHAHFWSSVRFPAVPAAATAARTLPAAAAAALQASKRSPGPHGLKKGVGAAAGAASAAADAEAAASVHAAATSSAALASLVEGVDSEVLALAGLRLASALADNTGSLLAQPPMLRHALLRAAAQSGPLLALLAPAATAAADEAGDESSSLLSERLLAIVEPLQGRLTRQLLMATRAGRDHLLSQAIEGLDQRSVDEIAALASLVLAVGLRPEAGHGALVTALPRACRALASSVSLLLEAATGSASSDAAAAESGAGAGAGPGKVIASLPAPALVAALRAAATQWRVLAALSAAAPIAADAAPETRLARLRADESLRRAGSYLALAGCWLRHKEAAAEDTICFSASASLVRHKEAAAEDTAGSASAPSSVSSSRAAETLLRGCSSAALLSLSPAAALFDDVAALRVRAAVAAGLDDAAAAAATRTSEARSAAAAAEAAIAAATIAAGEDDEDEDNDGFVADAPVAATAGAAAKGGPAAIAPALTPSASAGAGGPAAGAAHPFRELPPPVDPALAAAATAATLQLLVWQVRRATGAIAETDAAASAVTAAPALSLQLLCDSPAVLRSLSAALAAFTGSADAQERVAKKAGGSGSGGSSNSADGTADEALEAAEGGEDVAAAAAWHAELSRSAVDQAARLAAWAVPSLCQLVAEAADSTAAAVAPEEEEGDDTSRAHLSGAAALLPLYPAGLAASSSLSDAAAALLEQALPLTPTGADANSLGGAAAHVTADNAACCRALQAVLAQAAAVHAAAFALRASPFDVALEDDESDDAADGAAGGAGAASGDGASGGIIAAASSLLSAGSKFLSSWLRSDDEAAGASAAGAAPVGAGASASASASAAAARPLAAATKKSKPCVRMDELPVGQELYAALAAFYLQPACSNAAATGLDVTAAAAGDASEPGAAGAAGSHSRMAAAASAAAALYNAALELPSCLAALRHTDGAASASTSIAAAAAAAHDGGDMSALFIAAFPSQMHLQAAFPLLCVAAPAGGDAGSVDGGATAADRARLASAFKFRTGSRASAVASSSAAAVHDDDDDEGAAASAADTLAAILALDDSAAGMTFRGRSAFPPSLASCLEGSDGQIALVLAADAAADALEQHHHDKQARHGRGHGHGDASDDEDDDDASSAGGSADATVEQQVGASVAAAVQAERAAWHARSLLLALEVVSRAPNAARTDEACVYLCAGDVSVLSTLSRWANGDAASDSEGEGEGDGKAKGSSSGGSGAAAGGAGHSPASGKHGSGHHHHHHDFEESSDDDEDYDDDDGYDEGFGGDGYGDDHHDDEAAAVMDAIRRRGGGFRRPFIVRRKGGRAAAAAPRARGGGAGKSAPAPRLEHSRKTLAARQMAAAAAKAAEAAAAVAVEAGSGAGGAGGACIQGARLTTALQACLHLALATIPLASEASARFSDGDGSGANGGAAGAASASAGAGSAAAGAAGAGGAARGPTAASELDLLSRAHSVAGLLRASSASSDSSSSSPSSAAGNALIAAAAASARAAQTELALLAHCLVRRVAELLPHTFTSLARSLPRGLQTDIQNYVAAAVTPRLFARQTVHLRALLGAAAAASGGADGASAGGGGGDGGSFGGAAALPALSSRALPLPPAPALALLLRRADAAVVTCAAAGRGRALHPPRPGVLAAASHYASAEDVAEARRKLRSALSTKDFASLSSGDFTVRCSSRDRDVHAVYRRDEAVLQLRIRLPPAFPLQRVRITCEQRMGVTEAQWATWELQMYALLSAKVRCCIFVGAAGCAIAVLLLFMLVHSAALRCHPRPRSHHPSSLSASCRTPPSCTLCNSSRTTWTSCSRRWSRAPSASPSST